jgi:type IV secretory pathway VirD2 relaxase
MKAKEHEPARVAFNSEREGVDLGGEMHRWQQADDRKYFHVIVSPENGNVPVTTLTRDLMGQMEKDLGTKLEWVGVEHRDTATPHTHVVVRGVDERGNELRLGHNYMRFTLRDRAEAMATNTLGYRTTDQVIRRRNVTMGREAFTETDRSLLTKMNENHEVTFPRGRSENAAQQALVEQEQRRVVYLASIGLAKQTGERSWQLHKELKDELRFRGANREHAPEWRKPKEQENTPERRRHVVRVIESERTQGRGR